MTAERTPWSNIVEFSKGFQPGLEECVATFREWLHFPDPGALHVVLAAIVANRNDDDPVWPLIVGSPGSGKTEIIGSISSQPDVYPAATLTEASLLSGTSVKERAANAKGGLLRQIGDFGIIVCKDFGSVLSMNRDGRATVLAALREVYDGEWTRHVGTSGGQTLAWKGKVGLIAGCTPTIDSHTAVMGSMGERFVLYRVVTNEGDDLEQARRALSRSGDRAMRKALSDAVAPVLAAGMETVVDALPDDVTREWLVQLSTFAVRCRSAVERDTYNTRAIELVPGAEMPARLALVLWRMLRAMRAIGVSEEEARTLTIKLALDSMSALRRSTLEAVIAKGADGAATRGIGLDIGYPTTTVKRALEDLAAHGVLERANEGDAENPRWYVSKWSEERLRGIYGG